MKKIVKYTSHIFLGGGQDRSELKYSFFDTQEQVEQHIKEITIEEKAYEQRRLRLAGKLFEVEAKSYHYSIREIPHIEFLNEKMDDVLKSIKLCDYKHVMKLIE